MADQATKEFIDAQVDNTEKLIKYLNTNLYEKTPKVGVNPNMPLTNKTKSMIQKRCKGLGLQLPKQALVSEAKARKWLQANPWVISDAMKRKINQIVMFKKIPHPNFSDTDFGKAIDFIKNNEDGVPNIPSPQFVDYAKKLAAATGQKIPPEAYKNAKMLGNYVDQLKRLKKPSPGLIKAINALAAKLKVKVPMEAFESDSRAGETYTKLKALARKKKR
jgi:hypothetical protein